MAARGANVCRVHGGSAPQVKAAAQRRIQQALDAAAKRLTGFAFDEGVSESIALAAVNGILDRGGLGAKQALELSAKPPEPYEELLGDVMAITKAQHEAMKRGDYQLPDPPALPPAEVVDAEVVEDPPESPPDSTPNRADRPPTPESAEPPPASRTGQLVPLEQAMAEAAAANRAARLAQIRRKR
jgi:hypothetical protein